MMKLFDRKKKILGNKGFSLVELIIVIAIMAVLIAVLAPQYIKYVERSRVSSDDATAAALLNAVKVAMADEAVYTKLLEADNIVWDGALGGITVTSAASADIIDEIESVFGIVAPLSLEVKSNTYSTQDYTININIVDSTPVAIGAWA